MKMILEGWDGFPSCNREYELYEEVIKSSEHKSIVKKYEDFLTQKTKHKVRFNSDDPEQEKPNVKEIDKYPYKVSMKGYYPLVENEIEAMFILVLAKMMRHRFVDLVMYFRRAKNNISEIKKLLAIAKINSLVILKISSILSLNKYGNSFFFDMTRITDYVENNLTNAKERIKYLKGVLLDYDDFLREAEYQFKILRDNFIRSNDCKDNPYIQEFLDSPDTAWNSLIKLQLNYKKNEDFKGAIEKNIAFYQEQAGSEASKPQKVIDIHWGSKTLVILIIKILHKACIFPNNTLTEIYSMILVRVKPISVKSAFVTNSKYKNIDASDAGTDEKDLILGLPSVLQLAIKYILGFKDKKEKKSAKALEKNKKTSR